MHKSQRETSVLIFYYNMDIKQISAGIIAFFPFIKTIRKYSFEKFRCDIVAALTVAIVALPQSMAYAIIAGINPKYGLYASIVPVIVSSLFGSSKFLIAGPTNAISMVLSSTLASAMIAGTVVEKLPDDQKIAILFLLAFMIGAIQLIMGLARFGQLINFISHSVIIGFTTGAGFLIAFNQLKNLLGISIGSTHHIAETAVRLFESVGQTNWHSLSLGLFTIAFIIIAKRISAKIPGPFLAMLASAVLVGIFGLGNFGVKLIGNIPQSLPPLSSFPWNRDYFDALFLPALAIAILGIVEALSIAKSIANSSGERINGNQEFIGQGLSNIAAAFTSGMPGSGSFTRSAVNFKAGARTRLAGVFSGLVVLLTLLLFASFTRFIPIPSLAGILMVIAYSMIDKKGFVLSFRATRTDRMVMITTMLTTIFFELEQAVYVGVFLSVILFLRKVSHPQIIKVIPRKEDNKFIPYSEGIDNCPQLSIYQIDGSLFFGAIEEMEQKLYSFDNSQVKAVVVRMRGVRIIDATGVHALEKFIEDCHKHNTRLVLTGIRPAVMKVLDDSGLSEVIGSDNVTDDTTQAIQDVFKKNIDRKICLKCGLDIFRECSAAKSDKA